MTARAAARRAAGKPPPRSHLLDLLGASFCALVALWLYRRALGSFFTTDDFVYFERATGLLPSPETAWRFLAVRVYPWLAVRLFGRDPLPFLATQWLLHASVVVLLYVWVRRRANAPAAVLAAGLWAGSRLFLTVVHQMSMVSETAALGLAIGALLLAERLTGPRRWSATLVFLLALACKESVAMLPVLLVLPGGAPGKLRERLARAAPLLAVGGAWIAWLVITASKPGGLAGFSGDAYRAGVGPHLFQNLARYAAWSLDLTRPVPDLESDFSFIPALLLAGLGAWALVLARRGRPLALLGLAGWLFALAPVLPLLHGRYLHYLYAPCAFLAASLAGLVPWATPMKRRGALVWMAVIAAVIVHASWSEHLIAERYRRTLPGLALPYDSFLRKTEYARRFAAGLRGRLSAERVHVLVLEPPGTARVFGVRSGREQTGHETPGAYDFVSTVLEGGRALRFLFPQVDTVAFSDHWQPAHHDWMLVTHRVDGRTTVHGRGPAAHVSVGEEWMKAGLDAQAAEHLARALEAYPLEPGLRFTYAVSLGRQGREGEARAQLERLIRDAPASPEAAEARRRLAAEGRP